MTGDARPILGLANQFTTQVAETLASGVCQPEGAPCGNDILVPCCSGLARIARLGETATCR